jgi:hypothetical protein
MLNITAVRTLWHDADHFTIMAMNEFYVTVIFMLRRKSLLALASIFIFFLGWLYRQIGCSYTEAWLPMQNMAWQSWHQHSVWMSCNLVNCMWIIGSVL